MGSGSGQRGKRRGRYGSSKRIYGTKTQEREALKLATDWKKRAYDSSPLKDPTAKEALAEALAAVLVTLRLLREAMATGALTADEIAKIPALAGKAKQLCEALQISEEVEEEEGDLD